MMTPQEVANCTFAKSMVGGYNMASVDDFLDKLTEDYAALYKENAALKAKLKMTVDKMSEYKESEDAIRSTLLAAQKMSTAMISEAEQKRDALIGGATSAAKNRMAELQQQIADAERRLASVRFQVDRELETERKRLTAGQEQLRRFIQEVRAVCNEELRNLELLPELPVEEPEMQVAQAAPPTVPAAAAMAAVEAPETVEEMPNAGADMPEIPEMEQAVAAFAPIQEPEGTEEPPKPRQPLKLNRFQKKASATALPEEDPFAEDELEDASDTRVLNLDDLQFGPNYMKD